MFFSRPIQWYNSHADPIWPEKNGKLQISGEKSRISYVRNPCLETPTGYSCGQSLALCCVEVG